MRQAVNVLVIVLILVVGAGLLVAGVAKVRSEAARVECTNNLQEVGQALANHYDQRGAFPAATLGQKDLYPEERLSWLVDLIDYWEQHNIRLDRDKAWDSDENRVPMAFREDTLKDGREERVGTPVGELRLFLCPSNPHHAAGGSAGLTHYVGVAGVGPNAAALLMDDPMVGVFGYARRTRLEDIKDGTSTTLVVIETARENGPWTAGGWPTVRGLDPVEQPYLGRSHQFGGTHPGGTMALFADGSARLLRDSISPRRFEAMATIAGGEQVHPFDAE
jgi:prepilin-type processing-associated H-X9-DG protein